MERLARARVIVFGLGGVGSYAVEGLVRSGIGRLTVVDFDEVCVTNLNRQLHATVRTVGKSKAELMAQRCREVNPECTVEGVPEFYRAETSEQLLQPGWDFIVDAIDNVKAKLHLLNRCVQLGVPVVSSMGAAGRLDPTAIRVDDLCETIMDPFAKDVRKLLRRKYGVDTERWTGITAVYSIEPPRTRLERRAWETMSSPRSRIWPLRRRIMAPSPQRIVSSSSALSTTCLVGGSR